MKFSIIFLLVFHAQAILSLPITDLLRPKREGCKGDETETKFEYCNAIESSLRYTFWMIEIRIHIDQACDGLPSIKWDFRKDGNTKPYDSKYTNKAVYVIAPSDNLIDGMYTLTVKVQEKGLEAVTDTCKLELMSEPPVVVFVNGRVHTERMDTPYMVDITPSISKLPIKPEDVIWADNQCKFSNRAACKGSVCPPKPTALTLFVPADPCRFSIEVQATLQFHKIKIFAKQIVHYIPQNRPMVEFRCKRNCDMEQNKLTNPAQETHISLTCLETCAEFNKFEHEYEIVMSKTNKKIPASNFEVKNNVDVIIKKNAFNYNSIYKLTMKTKGNAGSYSAMTFFRTSLTIEPPDCYFTPNKGKSMQTVFMVQCEPAELYGIYYPSDYNVYQTLPDGTEQLVASSSYRIFDFVLGSTGQPTETLYVSGHDLFFKNYKISLGSIKLEQQKITDKQAEALAAYVDDASSKGDYARAVQIANGMLLEVERDPSFKKGTLYKNVLNSLKKIAVESVDSYNRIGSLLKTFYKTENPEYRNELSNLCKKVSETQLSSLKRGLYNVQMDDEAKALLNPLKECANKLLDAENLELDEIIVTEPPELVDDPAVIEDYPNYDQAFFNKEEELVKSNAIDTVMNSALATALTINPGDEVEEPHNNTFTKVSKEFGRDLFKKEIALEGVNVTMSTEDDTLDDKKITTIVTTYNKDLFKSTDLDSFVVDIGVFDMEESTKKTANVRVDIKFDLENEPIPKDKYTATAPARRSAWRDPDIEYTMNVHRIDLPKHQVCSVEFKKLETGQRLQVVFVRNRRPKLEDFTKSNIRIVDSAFEVSRMLACPFKQHEHDSFIYMAVLPPDELATGSSGNVSIDYEVVFTSQYCLTYETNLKSWETADCNITFIPSAIKPKISCSCGHTTLFAAKNTKVESKLDLVQKIEYKTNLYINYVIFIHVAVVFAFYCIALIFAFKRVPKSLGRDKVIFLSDNLKNDRYAYILIVTTGDYAKAGTTANVMVQIFAEKANSKPHVLNYPDPDKKLLQRNNVDWFVLTNDLYLGDISYIEVWFDGIGYRPTWYCENIYVVDLQNRKEWYFNVQKLFTLRDDVSTEFKIEPSNTFEVSENVMDTIIKHSKFHVGAELTWNIFLKSNDNSFSYSQRLTVILSMIYTTYVLVILFMYPPVMRIADAYAYGYFQFTNEVLVIPPITSILSCLINLPFVYFFRNSENETNFYAFFKEQKTYPMIATTITWVVLVLWIVVCMLYLVIFGYFVTIHTAYFWIFATILSILMGIFIVENLSITVLSIIQARLTKFKISHYDFVGMIKEIENQRKILFAVFGEMLLRPYFLEHYKHLTREKILEMMQMEIRRNEVARLCKDFFVFLVYLGLLYAICFANVDPQDYQSNRAMRRMLNGEFFNIRRNRRQIQQMDQLFTIKDVYYYINYTIIPLIHATNWYGNYHSKDAGQMLDFNTKILGVAQLRQQRREQNCYPTYPMNLLDIKCDNISKTFKNWEFNNGSEIAYTLGVLENYGGEGYVANMGRTLYNSYFMLNLLNKVNWIDINTKVLFIDFWTYNPNYNIFNLVKVTIERSPTGHYAKSHSVFTTRLLYASALNEALVILLIIAFILIITYNMFTSILNMVRVKGKFFNQGWEIVDAILVILSIAVCALYFHRRNIVKTIMEKLVNTDHNKFVNYFALIKIAKVNTWISSALVCLATLRLWKFLRFAIIFRALERTLWRASSALLMTFLYQAFIYFNFTFYIHMMYGQTYHLFQSYRQTFSTLFLISINFFDDFHHTYLSQYGAEIYILYTLFFLSSIVFLTIYSTIIILGLEESQIYYSNKPEYYSLKNYWIDQGTYYTEVLKRHNKNTRLRGGQDEQEEEPEMVYPKEVSKRYVNCISMDNEKMLLMRFVAVAVIKKRRGIKENLRTKRMTEDHFKLLARIAICLTKAKKSKKDENLLNPHLFFHGKDPIDNSIKFVSNDTILRIEFAAKYMLESKPPEITYKKDRYIIHVDGDNKRLAYYRDVLEIINKSIDNIKIVPISKAERMKEAAKAPKGGKFEEKKQKKKGKDEQKSVTGEKKEIKREKKMGKGEAKTVTGENKKVRGEKKGSMGEKKTVKHEKKVKKKKKSEEGDKSS